MKADKVDHYLNKRKESEARSAITEEESVNKDHGQSPNRSPASEESNKSSSQAVQEHKLLVQCMDQLLTRIH